MKSIAYVESQSGIDIAGTDPVDVSESLLVVVRCCFCMCHRRVRVQANARNISGPSALRTSCMTSTSSGRLATTRYEDLWFEDGNVILAVGDKEFKLYRGPLMAHSLAFRDMLSLPQPESGPASADDACPVIRLDESVENLRHLLRRIPLSRTGS